MSPSLVHQGGGKKKGRQPFPRFHLPFLPGRKKKKISRRTSFRSAKGKKEGREKEARESTSRYALERFFLGKEGRERNPESQATPLPPMCRSNRVPRGVGREGGASARSFSGHTLTFHPYPYFGCEKKERGKGGWGGACQILPPLPTSRGEGREKVTPILNFLSNERRSRGRLSRRACRSCERGRGRIPLRIDSNVRRFALPDRPLRPRGPTTFCSDGRKRRMISPGKSSCFR